jgi:hypothetical protein
MTGLLRLIGLLILAIFAITIIRTVVGIAAKWFTGGAGSGTPRPSKPPKVQAGGTLHRCPACGTYTSESLAVKRISGEDTHYFCSPECAGKGARTS